MPTRDPYLITATTINDVCVHVHLQVFQCLLIEGENAGEDAKRNAERYVISNEQFESFLQRHKSVPQLVPESNAAMRDSYLLLDEYVRLQCGGPVKWDQLI